MAVIAIRKNAGAKSGKARQRNRPLTLAQQARATLRHVRFASGERSGPARLSPSMAAPQRAALKFWMQRLPEEFRARLPELNVAVARELNAVRHGVFINERLPQRYSSGQFTHAVSFLPQRYIVLSAGLFRRRVELGRILYHELCHFVWPRLGNPKRRRFRTVLRRELRERVRGELGYSAELRKRDLIAKAGSPATPHARRRAKAEYVCESFCDTGAFVLLGDQRRGRHSEYTLSRSARRKRCDVWNAVTQAHTEAASGNKSA